MAFSRLRTTFFGAALGAAAAYYLDPDRGRARRTRHRDQLISKGREVTREVDKKSRYVEGQLEGARARADGKGEFRPESDADIKQAINQRLSGLGVDTSDIVIDVTDGVAGLRGQVQRPEEMKKLEIETSQVPGVEKVNSWLHLPGDPAPNKAQSLSASPAHEGTSIS